jgi:membrane protease YdiL (CAAX protease family)
MKTNTRRQLIALSMLLAAFALVACATYLVVPLDQLAGPGQTIPAAARAIPRWQLALGNVGFILVAYGLLGLAGYWFARKVELPGIFREGAGWRAWFLWPMLLGLALGGIVIAGDQIFAAIGASSGYPHPAFPLSVLASAAAGIGEEILSRGFIMGLWAFLLNLALRRWNGRTLALWIANVIAALAFSAVHLPSAMILLNVASPTQIPAVTLAELFILNGFLGLAAGQRYMRDGLVAAVGVHFWADILWHVIWPLTGLGA